MVYCWRHPVNESTIKQDQGIDFESRDFGFNQENLISEAGHARSDLNVPIFDICFHNTPQRS